MLVTDRFRFRCYLSKILDRYVLVHTYANYSKSLATAYAHNHIRTLYLGRKSLASKIYWTILADTTVLFTPVFLDRKAFDCTVLFCYFA